MYRIYKPNSGWILGADGWGTGTLSFETENEAFEYAKSKGLKEHQYNIVNEYEEYDDDQS